MRLVCLLLALLTLASCGSLLALPARLVRRDRRASPGGRDPPAPRDRPGRPGPPDLRGTPDCKAPRDRRACEARLGRRAQLDRWAPQGRPVHRPVPPCADSMQPATALPARQMRPWFLRSARTAAARQFYKGGRRCVAPEQAKSWGSACANSNRPASVSRSVRRVQTCAYMTSNHLMCCG